MKSIALKLREKLIKSVQKKRASGLLFSGGVDSGILAALSPTVKAITVSLKFFGKDIHYAGLIAKDLRLKHFHRSVDIEEAINSIPEVIKILRTFDPAIPNDLVVYFGLKLAKKLGINEIMTGDGSDELFAGYSYMQEIDNLQDYIKKLSRRMGFSSNKIGEFFNIDIIQPFIDKDIIDFSLMIPVDLKIKKANGNSWGKWILRKAFEGMLTEDVIWQDKRPLEYGSGMRQLRDIISDRVSDEEFRENSSSIKFISKEHFYYYKVYREVVGEISKPKSDEKSCPGCGGGIRRDGFHCKICGYVLKL